MSKQQPIDKSAFLLGVILAKLENPGLGDIENAAEDIVRLIQEHFNYYR